MLRAVARRTRCPIVLVLIHGSSLDVSWAAASPRVGAIISAWYPGQQGGAGIVDVMLAEGGRAPQGRLPVSFLYQNYTLLEDYFSMDMRMYPGRTHRYLQVDPLFPFGFGLSYGEVLYLGPLVVNRAEDPI